MNEQLQSTLFVGIDVSSKSNYVYAMDFFAKKLLSFSCFNNLPGVSVLITNLCNCLETENLKYVVIAMESTSYYSFHICNYLSSSPELACYKPKVYCLNPKVIKAYRESFISLDKTDPLDSMVISDFARTGKITSLPFQSSAFVALQRLTRQRLHIVENLNREISFALSNIFLKFSELAVLDKNEQPFSNKFGATASAIVTEFLCPDEIACMPLEQLIDFICEKGKSRFSNPENTAKLLQKACRDSYRLDKALYDPLNVTIAASFNCISSLEKQIKELDKAILKAVKGLSSNEYQCLLSIKGIGPVFAARHYC